MRYPIVDVRHLSKCVLWKGSMLETTFRFEGGLPLEDVIKKRDALKKTDDRTAGEDELLQALEQTITDPFGTKETS